MRPVARLASRFRGLDRAHGESSPLGSVDPRGKVKTRYTTKRLPITDEDWADHLAGKRAMVPIPITDDGKVFFGAIDIDDYELDIKKLAREVERLGLPLVVCRSKSGGAHLFVFRDKPEPATRVQEKLFEWAQLLGYPSSEVFPKQTRLASENDIGNGIAAPYFGGESSTEYALDGEGRALSLTEFLDRADEVARVDLDEVEVPEDDLAVDLDGAPPCLVSWARSGVPEGSRNEVMFDFAVYAKKRWPDDWKERFEEINRRICVPPLPASELMMIQRSLEKAKDYSYKAKCQGPRCQALLCARAKFGRSSGSNDPGVYIDGLVILDTEPKTYILSVDGRRIELPSEALLNQKYFRRVVLEKLDILVNLVKEPRWTEIVRGLLDSAEHEEAPPDASPRGQVLLHIQDYVDRFGTSDRERLLLEHPWIDSETGQVFFRSKDVLGFLRKERVGIAERDVYNIIRSAGGGNKTLRVGSRVVRCWWLPVEALDMHLEDEEMPKTPEIDSEVPF